MKEGVYFNLWQAQATPREDGAGIGLKEKKRLHFNGEPTPSDLKAQGQSEGLKHNTKRIFTELADGFLVSAARCSLPNLQANRTARPARKLNDDATAHVEVPSQPPQQADARGASHLSRTIEAQVLLASTVEGVASAEGAESATWT